MIARAYAQARQGPQETEAAIADGDDGSEEESTAGEWQIGAGLVRCTAYEPRIESDLRLLCLSVVDNAVCVCVCVCVITPLLLPTLNLTCSLSSLMMPCL